VRPILALILALLLAVMSVPAAWAEDGGMPEISPFDETVMVCNSLYVYAQLAAQFRDQGMPREQAKTIARDSMTENLTHLPAEMREPYVGVVMEVYDAVYADPAVTVGGFDTVIRDACYGYRDYNLDRAALEAELDGYVQSAFDPLKRVPVCEKAGQTAANLTVARDQGMTQQESASMAVSVLGNDTRTNERLPRMLEEVYAHPQLGVPVFYLYNIRRCQVEADGGNLPPLKELAELAAACQQQPTQDAQGHCLLQLFTP
jgi:hypothetical protein